jgi:hypothetical protein
MFVAAGVELSDEANTLGTNMAERQSTSTIVNDAVLVISLCLQARD